MDHLIYTVFLRNKLRPDSHRTLSSKLLVYSDLPLTLKLSLTLLALLLDSVHTVDLPSLIKIAPVAQNIKNNFILLMIYLDIPKLRIIENC